jgi:hypothetical protein
MAEKTRKTFLSDYGTDLWSYSNAPGISAFNARVRWLHETVEKYLDR